MKNNIYLQDKIRRKFFNKILFKERKMWKYFFSNIFLSIKNYLGIIDYIKYSQQSWKFLDEIDLKKEIDLQKELFNVVENIQEQDKNIVVLLPRKILDLLDLKQEVVALDEIDYKKMIVDYKKNETTIFDGINTPLSKKYKYFKKIKKGQVKKANRSIRYILLFSFLFIISVSPLLVSIIYSVATSNRWIISEMISFNVFIFNIVPIFLVMCFFYFISKRAWMAYLFTSVIVYIIAISNYFKQNLRHEPLYVSDIFTIREGMAVAGEYKIQLTDKMWLIFIITFVLMIIIHNIPKLLEPKIKERVIGSVLSLVILFGPVLHFYGTELAQELTYSGNFLTKFDVVGNYSSRGVIYSFMNSYFELVGRKPKGYSQEVIDNLLKEYPEVSLSENQKVNVLMIMMESYTDLSRYQDFSNNEIDPYYNLHKLQEESYSGELLVDVFAGGTIQTERASMTGYNKLGSFIKETESFPQFFKRQGYATEFMHPFLAYFYGRNKASFRLGFDVFSPFENIFEIDQSYDHGYKWGNYKLMSDDMFIPEATYRFLNSVEKNSNAFDFATTIQGHGPYATTPLDDQHYLPYDENMSEELYTVVNNYLFWVKRTDNQLKFLKDTLDASEDPIVLVLFGDHLPALGTNGKVKEWYNYTNTNMNTSEVEGLINNYTTPYLFYLNPSAKESLNVDDTLEGNLISPMYLVPELFDYLNLEGSSYLNYLKDLKEVLPVQNIYAYKYKDDWFYRGEEYPEDLSETIRDYESFSYYTQYKYNNK
ncbi:MAG: LTA synthase family protein [Anaerorhabdus sp.]